MARYVARIRSPLPAAEAFAIMADMRTYAEWDPGVSAVEQVDGHGPGLRAAFDLDVATTGTPLDRLSLDATLRYVTTTYVEPREVHLVADGRLLRSVDVITVRPVAGGCVVTYDADLQLKPPLRVGPLNPADLALRPVFRVIGGRAEAGMRAALQGSSMAPGELDRVVKAVA